MSSNRLELVIDASQAQRELNRLEGRLNGVDRAGNRADRSMQGLAGSISGVRSVTMAASGVFATLGIATLGRDVFNTVAGIEKMRASLVTMTGSVEGANAAWEQMREFAKTTPFELEQSVQAFIRMKGMGLDPTEESMRAFANTASATGKDLIQMVEAVADAATGEYERLKEFNIKSSAEGDKVAFTFQGVTTTIQNSSENIVRYLENIGNTTFAGAAIAQVDTLGGQLNNLGDKVDTLYATIGDAGATDLFNAALDGSAEAVEYLTNNVDNLAKGVDLLGDAAIIAAGLYTGRFVAGMAAGTLSLANKTKASIADARATATATAAEIAFLKSVQGSLSAQLASSRSAVQRASLRKQLAANTVALTAANNTYTASLGRSTVAARAMGAASRGAAGALTLLGGPLGILVGVGGLLYVFRDELGLTGHRAGLTEDQISDLRDEMQDMSQDDLSQSLSSLNNALDTATIKAATAREELAKLRSENRGSGVLGFGAGEIGAEVRGMGAVADAQERIADLNDKINIARGETASRIEQNANAFVVYADRIDDANEETRRAEEFNKTLSSSLEDAADKTYTLADAYESLLDRITPNRREAKQYARDLGVLNLALASGRMTTTQYMQAMGLLQESFQAAQRDSTDLSDTVTDGTDEMTREMERFGNSVDDVFVDAFKGAFDSFEDFADGLKNAFETLMAELAYAAVKNEIKIQLGMQTSGIGQGGLGDLFGGGGGGGIGSLVNGAKSLFGFGNSATAASSLGVQGGVSGTAITSANQVAAGSTGWMSSAASMAPQIAAAYAAGQMIQGGLESVGFFDAIGSPNGQAAEIGGQFGGIVGRVVGGWGDALFGSSPTKFKGRFGTANSATPGTFEHQDSDTEQFYQESAFGSVGFLDDGTKRLQRAGMGDNKEWAEQLASGAAQIDNLVASLAQGAPELDAMRSAVQGLEISSRDAGEIIEFALDERPRAALEALGGTFGDFVRSLEGGIESVVQQAQVAQQAHSVLSGSMERLNLQFDASSASAYGAASSIAGYVGGVENLANLQSGYYDTFFSEAERAANLQDDLTASLSRLGLELPETRKGFRDLVEAQNLNTEAGAQNYATLLQLAGGFDQLRTMMGNAETATEGATEAVADYSDAIRTQGSLERDLLRAQGNTEALRQREIDSLREIAGAEKYGLVALQERVWAIEDEATALEQAKRNQDAFNAAVENQQSQAMNALQSAFQGLQSSISALQDNARSEYEQTSQQINAQIDTLGNTMRSTERAASGLQSALDGMIDSGVSLEMRRSSGQEYLRIVQQSGGLGDPRELDRALSAVAEPSEGLFSTFEDYQRDFWSTASVVDELNERAQNQLSTEERMLDALEEQLTSAERAYESELDRLDGILETEAKSLEAQFGQLSWLEAINGSVLSLGDALAALESAAGGASSSGSMSYIEAKTAQLNRDNEGGRTWTVADTLAAFERDGLTEAEHYARYGKDENIPGFAAGGIATGPTSGYPVELHGTEAIIPLKGGNVPLHIPGMQALLREVAQLRSELAASQRAIAENTRKSARVLEREELERRQEEVV